MAAILMGPALRNKREATGLTVTEVAKACGIDTSTLSKWERGDIINPRGAAYSRVIRYIKQAEREQAAAKQLTFEETPPTTTETITKPEPQVIGWVCEKCRKTTPNANAKFCMHCGNQLITIEERLLENVKQVYHNLLPRIDGPYQQVARDLLTGVLDYFEAIIPNK